VPPSEATLDCRRVEEGQLAEDYLRGTLAEADRDAFESHLFECSACFERVETLRLLRAALEASDGGANAAAAAGSVPRAPRRPWVWVGIAAAVAAASVVATRPWPQGDRPGVEAPSSPTRRAPDLSDLARFQPPAYERVALRGSASDPERLFDEAMKRYTARDCAGAVPGLQAAARRDPSAPAAAFFLGVCQLLLDRAPEGVASLQRTIALGDSPYLEPARFYTAKGHLRLGDPLAALSELEGAILLRGDLETDARRLAAQVRGRLESPAPR
jgi:hypothetical protein